ncbi:hypothetical protein CRG98_035105 [Punica granatum]|uniref:Uncharacterized protein n=1 Tax=Punica granatum TaxID=22663 RepID=A0A2I0IKI8_PUNGR|nr:hypothetical protein CRG98_035105 [Punica granatum]
MNPFCCGDIKISKGICHFPDRSSNRPAPKDHDVVCGDADACEGHQPVASPSHGGHGCAPWEGERHQESGRHRVEACGLGLQPSWEGGQVGRARAGAMFVIMAWLVLLNGPVVRPWSSSRGHVFMARPMSEMGWFCCEIRCSSSSQPKKHK